MRGSKLMLRLGRSSQQRENGRFEETVATIEKKYTLARANFEALGTNNIRLEAKTTRLKTQLAEAKEAYVD